MFRISKLGPRQEPKWKVSTRAGVMFRECAQTQRIQYRDCGTGTWIDVEGPAALAWLIRSAQEVSRDAPPWIRNRKAEQT
ncbi:MAG: hypothetical protein PVF91_00020 [Chromatiales bacterium]|jgi:hypothetical protein